MRHPRNINQINEALDKLIATVDSMNTKLVQLEKLVHTENVDKVKTN